MNERSHMKKILILSCICLIISFGFSCEKKQDQESPRQQTTAPLQQQQPEKQPESTAFHLPILQAGVQIMNGDEPLSIGHTASPEVVDWNNDGKKDLLLGDYSNRAGNVWLFLGR